MDSRLPPWEQSPSGPPPPSRLCPQGHLLELIDGQPPSYNGGWMCDMCSAHLPPSTQSVLHCAICRFDVCSACQARAASAPPGAAFSPPPGIHQHLHFDLNELLGGGGAGIPLDLQGMLGGGGQGGIGDALNNLLQQIGPLFGGGAAGAPPAVQNVIDALPRVVVSELDEEPTCFVCQDQFLQFEAALQLPCSHLFHQDCISQWLARHATCPTCRASVANMDSSAAAIASASAPAARHFRPIHESRLPLVCEFTKLHGPQWCDVSAPDTNVKFLLPPCGCTIHLKCMRQWASMSGSSQVRRCPSCRTEFSRPIQLDMDQSDPEATPKRSNVTAQSFSSAIDELLASVGQGGASATGLGQDKESFPDADHDAQAEKK